MAAGRRPATLWACPKASKRALPSASCSPPRAATAPASTAPCRRSSTRSTCTGRRSTCARRSSTTSTWSSSSAKRGAIFVEEETEVPEGELVVFSAHGVAPSVHANAAAAQPAHDRRHLPAGDQGPRRGAQVRRAGLHDRAHRPPGSRGGRGDHRRGAREHRPGRDGRRRRRARAPRSRPRRLHHPDDALGRRDRGDHRPPARALPERSPRRSPTTSVTRPPTARSRSSSSPASASWCW